MPKNVEDLQFPCYSYLGIRNPNLPANATVQAIAGINKASAEAAAKIPRIGLVDLCYMPEPNIEFPILGSILLYYIPTLILFMKYRKHPIIKYRQPNITIIQSILGLIMSILIPLFRYHEIPCLLSTWIINPLVFSRSILTYSRYVRQYFLQKLSIFKLKFSESKNRNKKSKNDAKTGILKSKDVATVEIMDDSKFLGSNTPLNNHIPPSTSTISNDNTSDIMDIEDPILYFKKLDNLINKRIFLILVVIPTIFIIAYSIIITITKWEEMKGSCPNEAKNVGTPKLVLCICIIISSTFLLYQAYIKQKWDMEIRIEYTIYVIGIIICKYKCFVLFFFLV